MSILLLLLFIRSIPKFCTAIIKDVEAIVAWTAANKQQKNTEIQINYILFLSSGNASNTQEYTFGNASPRILLRKWAWASACTHLRSHPHPFQWNAWLTLLNQVDMFGIVKTTFLCFLIVFDHHHINDTILSIAYWFLSTSVSIKYSWKQKQQQKLKLNGIRRTIEWNLKLNGSEISYLAMDIVS